MPENKWLSGDAVSGLVLAALGGYIIAEARGWNYFSEEGPGPGFFPMWYGIAMVMLSLLLVLRTTLSSGNSEGKRIDWSRVSRALMAWAAFTASVALLKVLGFLLSLALLTMFVVAVMYGRPVKLALASAAGNAAGFYLIFNLALGLSLPTGMLGF